MIKLILNADDFGYSKVFNEKILDLLDRNTISSTTVMVNSITKEQDEQIRRLVEIAKRGRVGVGLHLELDSERPIRPQIEERYVKFISIFGFEPEHLDLHIPGADMPKFDAHWDEIDSAIDAFAVEKKIGYRNHGEVKLRARTTSQPVFTCSRASYEKIIEFVDHMKDGESYELLFHPGDFDPDSKSKLNIERLHDYQNAVKLHDYLKQRKQMKLIKYSEL